MDEDDKNSYNQLVTVEAKGNSSTPPKNYWVNTSGNEPICRLIKKADQTTKDDIL